MPGLQGVARGCKGVQGDAMGVQECKGCMGCKGIQWVCRSARGAEGAKGDQLGAKADLPVELQPQGDCEAEWEPGVEQVDGSGVNSQ